MSNYSNDVKDIILGNGKKKEKKEINFEPMHKEIKNLNSDDPDAPKKVNSEIASKIRNARCMMKLSQEDLAKKLNVKVNIIKDYERDSGITVNRIFLKKIYNILGI
jgi:ribosome-binding protein aMBF1 (putative translation factor)